MAGMVVEYDTEVDAFYVRVTEEEVARTVEVSAFVSVDIDLTARLRLPRWRKSCGSRASRPN
jgi:hypothetical protein